MSERFTIVRCPECGEYVPEHYASPMMPGRGHYHDDPDNRFGKRIFHPAEEVEVVPAAGLLSLEAELKAAKETLAWYADESNYEEWVPGQAFVERIQEAVPPNDTEHEWEPDGGERARGALGLHLPGGCRIPPRDIDAALPDDEIDPFTHCVGCGKTNGSTPDCDLCAAFREDVATESAEEEQ